MKRASLLHMNSLKSCICCSFQDIYSARCFPFLLLVRLFIFRFVFDPFNYAMIMIFKQNKRFIDQVFL